MAGSRVFTRSRRAAFFGVGIDHGDVSAFSSANRDEVDVAAGVTSSPKRDLELMELASGDSVGELPNKDIIEVGLEEVCKYWEVASMSHKKRWWMVS